MNEDKLYILQKAQEALESFKDNVGKMDNKDIKIQGAFLQTQLLSSYWTLQHYLETLDITGFPVKILTDTAHFYVRNKPTKMVSNIRKEFGYDKDDNYSMRLRIGVPKDTLGVLLDIKRGIHFVGVYLSNGDQFVTKYKLRLREQDYTTDLMPEERAKVERARKKLILRKYKKNNLKIVEKLQETKA